MGKTATPLQVPYDDAGNLLHYPERTTIWDNGGHRVIEPPMKDAITFTGALTYEGFARGRSAAYFHVKDSAGRTYPMFMSDLDAVLRTIGVKDGRIPEATWEPCKRGRNYGLRMAKGKR